MCVGGWDDKRKCDSACVRCCGDACVYIAFTSVCVLMRSLQTEHEMAASMTRLRDERLTQILTVIQIMTNLST